jgi:Mrp family chromosome partitioning ATPase
MLLVVRMQKTRRAAAERLQETLSAHGVKIYGVIANAFDAALAADAGYDYDSYGSYYTSNRDSSAIRNRPASAPAKAPV